MFRGQRANVGYQSANLLIAEFHPPGRHGIRPPELGSALLNDLEEEPVIDPAHGNWIGKVRHLLPNHLGPRSISLSRRTMADGAMGLKNSLPLLGRDRRGCPSLTREPHSPEKSRCRPQPGEQDEKERDHLSPHRDPHGKIMLPESEAGVNGGPAPVCESYAPLPFSEKGWAWIPDMRKTPHAACPSRPGASTRFPGRVYSACRLPSGRVSFSFPRRSGRTRGVGGISRRPRISGSFPSNRLAFAACAEG